MVCWSLVYKVQLLWIFIEVLLNKGELNGCVQLNLSTFDVLSS